MILDSINKPEDLKRLSVQEMQTLAEEKRELIIKKVNTTGGHMGPNLGIVETTIAMHYVFNSPVDKFVFDVSHQCYPHKMLTGRKEGFVDSSKYMDYTGYTAPEESDHDLFKIGHTSTSISLATGVAKARDLMEDNYNVIALIGDGSLSGGEAFQGLDNAAKLGTNFIVIVNDNEMSIAENYGGLYDNLKLLRDTNGQAECNFFKSLGYEYFYQEDGNDIEKMIETLNQVKDINHPVVVHVHTEKGKGLKPAEDNKEMFHWIMPGTLDEKGDEPQIQEENYTSITVDFLKEKAKKDKTVAVITAGTPGATGFTTDFRQELGSQFMDVGICEEHAIASCSGMAKMGAKPYFSVLSSFIQRTYDQVSQDLCLNNSPMTILVNWGAISEGDATHLGTFDIPLLANIPNLVYLAPTTKEEYLAMLEFSYNQKDYPLAIRVPFTNVVSTGVEDKTDYSKINKFEVKDKGEQVAIIGVGNFFGLAQEIKNELKNKNINATLINPKFLSGLDSKLLEELKNNHSVVITLEDGCLAGGFGEKVASYYGDSDVKVLNYGGEKEFTDRVSLDELYTRYHLKKELVIQDLEKILN